MGPTRIRGGACAASVGSAPSDSASDPARDPASDPTPTRDLALVRRFPALAQLPRVALGRFPTPVMHAAGASARLWIKRDDLAAEPVGGNKSRALEFLLAGVAPGDTVMTVGAEGSTHALAVALFARKLGARVVIGRWPQEMNDVARVVSARIEQVADESHHFGSVAMTYAWAMWRRLRRRRTTRWIPAGGSSPLGALGSVNAALELAEQIDAGVLDAPARIVVPLGSGGTMAGLALGLRVAGVPSVLVGARVVPRLVANTGHVTRLAYRTARLIERLSGERVPRVRLRDVTIAHDVFGGAYGRETSEGCAAADRLASSVGVHVDATYSAKAAALALRYAEAGPTLLWLTFDERMLRLT